MATSWGANMIATAEYGGYAGLWVLWFSSWWVSLSSVYSSAEEPIPVDLLWEDISGYKSCFEVDRLKATESSYPNCHADFIKEEAIFSRCEHWEKDKPFSCIFVQTKRITVNGLVMWRIWRNNIQNVPMNLFSALIQKKSDSESNSDSIVLVLNLWSLFQLIRKNNSSCCKSMQRHKLQKHMNEECEWRVDTCHHCKVKGSYKY